MKHLLFAILLIIVSFAPAEDQSTAFAECEPVCRAKCVKQEEKKHCWKVLREYVCIPSFKWPWQRCCEPQCGRVRCISVLEKHEIKCEKCGYEWEVKMVCTGGRRCGASRGGHCPDCGASCGCVD